MPQNVNFGIIQPTKQLGLQDVWKPISAVEQMQMMKAGMTLRDMYEERAFKDAFTQAMKSNKQKLAAWQIEDDTLKKQMQQSRALTGAEFTQEDFAKEVKRVGSIKPPIWEKIYIDTAQKFGMADRMLAMKKELSTEADKALNVIAVLSEKGDIDSAEKIAQGHSGAIEYTYPGLDPTQFSRENLRQIGAVANALKEGDTDGALGIIAGMPGTLGDYARKEFSKAKIKQKLGKPEKLTPFQTWKQRNPDKPVSEFFKIQAKAKEKPEKALPKIKEERQWSNDARRALVTSLGGKIDPQGNFLFGAGSEQSGELAMQLLGDYKDLSPNRAAVAAKKKAERIIRELPDPSEYREGQKGRNEGVVFQIINGEWKFVDIE